MSFAFLEWGLAIACAAGFGALGIRPGRAAAAGILLAIWITH